jgi:deoxyribonuclease-1
MYCRSFFFFFTIFLWLFATDVTSSPTSFSQAKVLSKQHVYFDQNQNSTLGTLYCGCDWHWVGRSGGRVDLDSCGYDIRAQETRAERTEWEHIVPASSLGRQLQCWQEGGRKNCQSISVQFNQMEANLFNLSPVVGEVNADRSNYNMGMVTDSNLDTYGHCQSEIDFKQRVFEPRDEAKGLVARTYFYMYDRYSNLKMSVQQQNLFIAWNKQFPVTDWELERESRISKLMGHRNDFVTGEMVWVLNHKGRGADSIESGDVSDFDIIHGNKRSRIYHLSNCPSYNAVKASNIAEFKNEEEAQKAGYRKAKNCP